MHQSTPQPQRQRHPARANHQGLRFAELLHKLNFVQHQFAADSLGGADSAMLLNRNCQCF